MSDNQNQNNQQDISQLLKVRREKLENLRADGKDPFVITKYDVDIHSKDIKDRYDELEGKVVSIAGRMMFKRVMGKASFCNIQDLKDRAPSLEAERKICRMTDFCRMKQVDYVPDPYYGGASGFENVLDILEDACAGLLEEIRKELC